MPVPELDVPVPTAAQLRWQQDRFGIFLHVGPNTALDREWGDGSASVETFAPDRLDVDGWVRTAAEAGARYVVLTAKHHDGFCLWPTRTTDYSVACSPWRGGAGDVVRESADACARHGVRLGIYVSPWDRHQSVWASDPVAYDEILREQVRELCTDYGELCEIWFDGAGSHEHSYDWDAVMAVVDELQPEAMVFNLGRPTIRWVGNEDGLAHDPVEYAVAATQVSNYTDAEYTLTGARYLPPECPVSIRPGWFWHPGEQPKSVEHLLAVYYRSVGMGANLLLNVPPDAHGRLDPRDVARLREVRRELDRRFAEPFEAELSSIDAGVLVDFGREVDFDHLVLEEDLVEGQLIRSHRITDAAGRELLRAGTIGAQRIHVLPRARGRQLTLTTQGESARVRTVRAYLTGVESIGRIAYEASTEPPDAD